MSLTRQIWLAIAVVMTIAFGAGFALSGVAARRDLAEQLRSRNVDNAAALALSLSQLPKDPATLDVLLAAQFEAGHFRRLVLADTRGRVLLERRDNRPVDGVPGWFVRAVRVAAEPGVARVEDGWRQFGTLTVESGNAFAYLELWRGMLYLLGGFVAAAAASGITATVLLRRIRRPLRRVVEQAEAIGARRFVTTPEPATPELRSVVRAMNALSERVRHMVEEESARVDALRREAQLDPLTGLLNRAGFVAVAEAALARDDAAGALVMLRVGDLPALNRELGREAADRVIGRVGARLADAAQRQAEWSAGRLGGADFAVLAGGAAEPLAVATRLAAEIHAALGGDDARLTPATAAARLRPGAPLAQLLAGLDRALAASAASGTPALADEAEDATPAPGEPADAEGWRSALGEALRPGRLQLARFPVYATRGDLLHFEAPARLQVGGEWLAAGRFLPRAVELGLASRLDTLAVDAALAQIARDGKPLAINLAAETIRDGQFHADLVFRLRKAPALAPLLWLEVPEQGALRHVPEFRTFCLAVKPFGCRVGLEHAGPQFARIGELHDLGLDYVKIDASIVRGIDANAGNLAFLRGLCLVAHTIGFSVIAEGVRNEAERDCVAALGLDGMTGPAIGPARPPS